MRPSFIFLADLTNSYLKSMFLQILLSLRKKYTVSLSLSSLLFSINFNKKIISHEIPSVLLLLLTWFPILKSVKFPALFFYMYLLFEICFENFCIMRLYCWLRDSIFLINLQDFSLKKIYGIDFIFGDFMQLISVKNIYPWHWGKPFEFIC